MSETEVVMSKSVLLDTHEGVHVMTEEVSSIDPKD